MPEATPLFSTVFLMSCWAQEYAAYCSGDADGQLLQILRNWAEKDFQKETVSEGGFIQTFFVNLWGYARSGEQDKAAGYVFKRISKHKEGGYYEANKQFIAPLPIPDASDEQKKQVAELAEKLQELHTAYRDELGKLEKRLSAGAMTDNTKTPQWIWAKLPDEKQLKASDAAKAIGLKGKALTDWAKAQVQEALASKLGVLASRLNPNLKLTVRNADGELTLLADGSPAFDSVYVDEDAADFTAVQWKYVIRSTNITPSITAEKLLGELLKLKQTDNASLQKQIVELDKKLDGLEQQIEAQEREMNALVYGLYGLTQEEVAQVERG